MFPHLRPADWNRHFLPHYGFGRTPAADCHETVAADLDGLHKRRGIGRAYIAPRGGAKSTWVTLAHVLRSAVAGWERHIIILSDSDDQAALLLASVKAELESNNRLALGYPRATGAGPEWKADRLRLPNGVLVEALGRGVRLRGRRNRASRPSLVVLDDVQGNRDVLSAAERTRAWEWFTREVLPAGDESTNFLSVGTALHREAISVRAGALPGWSGRTFKALHSFPERMDLWSEWERLLTNLADEKRAATAAKFFETNREKMEAGGRTYWPAKWPLWRLMAKRAEIGEAAFEAEYQGNPGAGLGAEWPPAYFDWAGFYFDDWPDDLVAKVIGVDPSKGTGEDGDDQAHALAGLGKDGTIYVDAVAVREDVTKMVCRAIGLARDWNQRGVAVGRVVFEDNATMGLLAPEIARQTREAGLLIPWETLTHTEPKPLRIRRAGPYLARRQIRVRNTRGGRLLVEQWRDFPGGAKDDCSDAAGTAIRRLELLVAGV